MTSLDRAMKKAFERRDQGVVDPSTELGLANVPAEEMRPTNSTRLESARQQTIDAKRELFVDAPENRLRGLHRPPDPSLDQRPAAPAGISRLHKPDSVPAMSVPTSGQSPIDYPSNAPELASLPPAAISDIAGSLGLPANHLMSYEVAVAGPVLDAWPMGGEVAWSARGDAIVPSDPSAPTDSDSTPVVEEQPFKPAWETDAFRLTPICQEIPTRLQVPLHLAVAELMESVAPTRPVVSISGIRPGAGATSVSIVLAQSLAKMGWKVIVIDSDTDGEGSSLGDQLGVAIDGGWNSAMAAGLDPAECCVQSLADGFCLLPFDRTHRAPRAATIGELTGLLRRLVGGFDVVLVDCGSQLLKSQSIPGDLMGARIIVKDRHADDDLLGGPAETAVLSHANCAVHIVENFAFEPST